jgi:uncharacterized membrane protein YraQ (UPF0718 family)
MSEKVTKKRRKREMLIPTVIMAALAIILLAIGYSKGEGQHIQGLNSGIKMIVEIIPLLLFAFIVAGMVQVLLPQELLSRWIGEESGLKGILIGTLAGGVTPGGPYVSLPVVAGLFKAGAGVGTLARLPMEIGILGWKFTLVRFTCTFFFPPIAGFIAQVAFSGIK